MCLICCIPIVTIGASVTALYSVTLKMVRGRNLISLKDSSRLSRRTSKSPP
ncbi:MAG: YesL family protein [Blautia marasmi]